MEAKRAGSHSGNAERDEQRGAWAQAKCNTDTQRQRDGSTQEEGECDSALRHAAEGAAHVRTQSGSLVSGLLVGKRATALDARHAEALRECF